MKIAYIMDCYQAVKGTEFLINVLMHGNDMGSVVLSLHRAVKCRQSSDRSLVNEVAFLLDLIGIRSDFSCNDWHSSSLRSG